MVTCPTLTGRIICWKRRNGPSLATAKVCFRMRFNGLVLHPWKLSANVGGARRTTIAEHFISVSFSPLSMCLLFVFIETLSFWLQNWCFRLLLRWFRYPWVTTDTSMIELTQGAVLNDMALFTMLLMLIEEKFYYWVIKHGTMDESDVLLPLSYHVLLPNNKISLQSITMLFLPDIIM